MQSILSFLLKLLSIRNNAFKYEFILKHLSNYCIYISKSILIYKYMKHEVFSDCKHRLKQIVLLYIRGNGCNGLLTDCLSIHEYHSIDGQLR